MTTKLYIIGLAIGLLAFGAANTWAAAQFNALKEYDHFKFDESEADDWSQSGKGNQIEFELYRTRFPGHKFVMRRA